MTTQIRQNQREKRRQRKAATPIRVIVTVVLVLLVCAGAAAVAVKIAHRLYIKVQKELYPLEYSEFVERYSRENDIDKYLIYAVIRTESGFRKDAESEVGASGLMQIMPDAFDWIKSRIGEDSDTYADMKTAEKNIKYGTYYIAWLWESFGNTRAAAAAYHAGKSRVEQWLDDPALSDDGVHLDTIPGADTNHYVNKITHAYEMYRKLYK